MSAQVIIATPRRAYIYMINFIVSSIVTESLTRQIFLASQECTTLPSARRFRCQSATPDIILDAISFIAAMLPFSARA